MTAGVNFEKLLFVLAGTVWGLYLFGAAAWVIGAVAGTIVGIAVVLRVASQRRHVRLRRDVGHRLP